MNNQHVTQIKLQLEESIIALKTNLKINILR